MARPKRRVGSPLIAALGVALCLLVASPRAHAEIVEAGYAGTIDRIDAALAAALPPGSPIAIGAPVVVNYAYESTTPDTDPDSSSGVYTGAITSFTLYVGTQVFVNDPAGTRNGIDILVDPFLDLYQVVDSVTADPPLPIVATLEGDVIFLAVNGSPLANDSLIAPPSPLDPEWDSAEAAITDDMNNTLINAVLDQQCTGPCPVPNSQPPVPVGHAAPLVLAIAAVGARALRGRRSAARTPGA